MKNNKKIAIAAISVLSIAGATTAVFGHPNFSVFSAECEHVGCHYSYVAPTTSSVGRKEYWKCCICGLVSETELSGTFQPGSDSYFGETDMIIPVHEHIDLNTDWICDDCGEEIDGIEGITINMPVDRLGPGEHTTLTAAAIAHGSFTGDVYWTLDTSTNRLTLVDNEDNTCTLTGTTNLVSSTVNSFKITATSLDDPTISKTITFYGSAFPTSRIQAIIDLVGADYVLPYCTFKAVGDFQTTYDYFTGEDYVSGYVKDSTSANNVIKAFDNNGTYTKTVDGTHTYYTKDIGISGYYVKYDVYVDYGWSYVDVYKVAKPATEFPVDTVSEFLADGTSETIIVPDDGTSFAVSQGASDITVTCDCDSNNYVSKLVAAGYTNVGNGVYVSPNRTLIVVISKSGSDTKLVYRTQEISTDTDWSSADKQLMIQKLGEAIPFVNAGYTWYDYTAYYGYLYGTPGTVDAYNEAIKVFDACGLYTKSTASSNVEYRKSIDENTDLSIKVDNSGYIYLCVAPKAFTEWKATEIANALGSLTTVTLPAATGSLYSYSFGTNTATITVTGSQVDYEAVLAAAGFIKTGTSGWTTNYKSADGTLIVAIENLSSTMFEITATAKEVAPAGDGFNWNTFVGDTLSNPLRINNGMGGKFNFVIELNNGSFVGYEKNNRPNTLVTLTGDSVGCTGNQLHLTGSDNDFLGLDYDFIIEYDEINSAIVLVSDNTSSNFVW